MIDPHIQTTICIDFKYKGFECTVIQYLSNESNAARTFLEGMSNNDNWWCSYVVLPENHTMKNRNYNDVKVDCHGGLTYAGKFHIKKSKNFGKWAIGCDFAHYNDNGGTKEQAIEECWRIVDQL
jgi:hypothetical protein